MGAGVDVYPALRGTGGGPDWLNSNMSPPSVRMLPGGATPGYEPHERRALLGSRQAWDDGGMIPEEIAEMATMISCQK